MSKIQVHERTTNSNKLIWIKLKDIKEKCLPYFQCPPKYVVSSISQHHCQSLCWSRFERIDEEGTRMRMWIFRRPPHRSRRALSSRRVGRTTCGVEKLLPLRGGAAVDGVARSWASEIETFRRFIVFQFNEKLNTTKIVTR